MRFPIIEGRAADGLRAGRRQVGRGGAGGGTEEEREEEREERRVKRDIHPLEIPPDPDPGARVRHPQYTIIPHTNTQYTMGHGTLGRVTACYSMIHHTNT